MQKTDFSDITPAELKKYIEENDEKSYTIIDVRQPKEYWEAHIPGSKMIPLPDLVSNMIPLPDTGDLVFMCRSGARSSAAAVYASPNVKPGQTVFNLKGGILDWFGKTLSGIPEVQLLGNLGNFDDVILSAMDLEKGAWNYYKTVLEKFPNEPFKDAMEYLSLAEADHAEALYRIMVSRKDELDGTPLPTFDDLFYSMKGDILEGGMTLDSAMKQLETITDDQAVHILELSLEIEFAAYDLYKNAARMVDDPEIKKILNGIANGEKNHMSKLANAFTLI